MMSNQFRLCGEGKKDQALGLLVVFIAILVYANSLSNGFVWDDTNVIVANPALQGSAISLFKSIDTNRDYELLPYYRPLTILTFLIEGRMHGLMPFLMHLFNVLLHAASAFLVYHLGRSLMLDIKAAFLAGSLFAVHPINTESVNFLSGGRNTMLACVFVLLAYLIHRRSIRRDSWAGGLAGSVFFLLGLFSKEIALMILPFIIALEIPPLRENVPASRSRAAIRLLPYAFAAGIYLAMRWMTLSSLGIQTSILPGLGAHQLLATYKIPELSVRLMDNLYIIPRYLLTVIWPIALRPRYEIPEHFAPFVLPLAAAWIMIVVVLVWLVTRGLRRATIFGLFWLAAFWLPVSGIVMFPSSPMADRYLYLPAIGLWLVAADQIVRLLSSGMAVRRVGAVVVTFVLILLAGITARRNLDWSSDIALFGRFAEQYPNDAYSHAGLGNAYFGERERDRRYLDLAEEEYTKALALKPVIPGVHTKMGYILLSRGDSEGARLYYSMALSVFPLDKEALLNRAIALENLGRGEEALEDFKRFLTIPGHELNDARPYAEERVRVLSQ